MKSAGIAAIKPAEEEILTRLAALFDAQALEKLARESRLIERSTSKLSGWMFLELHLLMEASGKESSLNQMCEELFERHGVELTKQSLDERFNTFAVQFMRQCFEAVFAQTLSYQTSLEPHADFERVLLTDATSFQLPAHLAAFYQGNGGGNGPSSIKIHQQYELLSGSVRQLVVRDGKENDAVLLQDFDYSQAPGELHLMDLGYFKLNHLQALHEAGGFFISRYKTGVEVCLKEGQAYSRLGWAQLLGKLESGLQLPEVYLGKGEQKLKARLIVEKVPEQVAAQRRLKQRRKLANHSRQARYSHQASALKALLMDCNIFITNTGSEQLSARQVELYCRLRWQIELLFKIWKSVLELDKVGKMSIFRFECYLYSRLLVLLLSSQAENMLRSLADGAFELSDWKAMKYSKKR